MSNTPRTDSVVFDWTEVCRGERQIVAPANVVDADFARFLEHETMSLAAQVRELREQLETATSSGD